MYQWKRREDPWAGRGWRGWSGGIAVSVRGAEVGGERLRCNLKNYSHRPTTTLSTRPHTLRSFAFFLACRRTLQKMKANLAIYDDSQIRVNRASWSKFLEFVEHKDIRLELAGINKLRTFMQKFIFLSTRQIAMFYIFFLLMCIFEALGFSYLNV